jgi:hypothetical protein
MHSRAGSWELATGAPDGLDSVSPFVRYYSDNRNPITGFDEDEYTPKRRSSERGEVETRPSAGVEWTSEPRGETLSEVEGE